MVKNHEKKELIAPNWAPPVFVYRALLALSASLGRELFILLLLD